MGFDSRELQKMSVAGRAIAEQAEKSFEEWATGESGVILKLWAGEVKTASPGAAIIRSRSRSAAEVGVQKAGSVGVTVNTGRRGGRPGLGWFRGGSKGNRTWIPTGTVADSGTVVYKWRHFKDAAWAALSEAMTDYGAVVSKAIPAGQKAIALGRQSVVQIADALGIALETVKGGGSVSGDGIAKARNALASDGKQYVNGTGHKQSTGSAFFIEMVNTYPRIQESGIDTALEKVLASRLALQRQTLDAALTRGTGVVLRNYPYLKQA